MGSYLICSVIILLIPLLGAVTTIQAAFTSTPTSVNVTVGSTATFNCSVRTGGIFWVVNGSTLPDLHIADITASTGHDRATLHIPAREEYNNTNVTCSVAIPGRGILYSDPVVLRVQGLLAAVGSLKANPEQTFVNLTWTPPFSLNITSTDPDFFYYVEVYNISTGETLIDSSYIMYDPNFNFMTPSSSSCDRFEFRVIPVNGAGNGSMAFVNGSFFEEPVCANASVLVDILSSTVISVEIFCLQPLQNICNSSIVATNENTKAALSPRHEESSLSVNVTNGTDGILFNYHYGITLELINGGGNIFIHKSLSLFDIQKSISNKCSYPGTVNTSCIFALNSQALGCLVVLHPWNTSQPEIFAYAARDNRSAPTANISIPGVPKGSHTVLVFDGEQNGLLSARAAAVQNVTVTEGGLEPPKMDSKASASIERAGGNICVNCSDMDDGESKGCVVVVRSNQTLESARSYEISGSSKLCVPQRDGEYSVAVFRQSMSNVLQTTPLKVSVVSIRTPTPTTSSPVPSVTPPTTPTDPEPLTDGAILVIVPMIVVIAVLTVIIGAVFMRKRKRNSKSRDLDHDNGEDCESSERLSLNSYQCAEKGEYESLRIVSDSGNENEVRTQTSLTYVTVDSIKPLCFVPPTDSSVEYSNIDHKLTANQQTGGPIYADLATPPGMTKPPSLDDRVQYSDILPQPTVPAPSVESIPPPLPDKSHITKKPPSRRSSINLDDLFSELYPMNPKWKRLAEVIGIDEDLVDEIDTNNERDEECLRAVLEVLMKKSPTWTTVTDSLRKIGEDQLAGSLYLKCILPGMVESPPGSEGISLRADKVVEPPFDDPTTPEVEPPPHDPTPPMIEPHDPTPPVVEPSHRDATPPEVEPPPCDTTPPVIALPARDPTPPVVALPPCDPTPPVVEPPPHDLTPPVIEPPPCDPTLVQHSLVEEEKTHIMGATEDSENDGGVEQEQGEERIPLPPCKRHAVKGLNLQVQNAEELRKESVPISLFSCQDEEQNSIQNESCDVSPHTETIPGTYCDSFHLLRFRLIQKQQLCKGMYLTPAQSTVRTSIVPVCMLVPTEYGHSDSKDCSETNEQQNVYLYSSPIQCASENDTATTSECVGPVKMESADAVQGTNEKVGLRLEVLERTLAKDVQAECEDEKTFGGARSVESQKNPQRNRSTEMILTSHANSLGACCQILRHCLRGMQPLCSGSSSEYKMLAIVKVCDRVKYSVQLDELMQHVAEKQLVILAFSGVIHSFGNNLVTSSSPDLLLDVCSLTGKPNKVARKSQPGKVEWLHSKKANTLPCMTFSKSCVQPVFTGHLHHDTFAYLTGASNHKENAKGEKETQFMGLKSRIMFQQVKRVVARQLQAKTKYNCPFTVKDNYADEVVIQSMLLVKALIHNFLHSAKILEKLDEIKRDVSGHYKQTVGAFNISQIIFHLKSKWFQYSRKGYNFLLKIKADAIHTFETTLKMQGLCNV